MKTMAEVELVQVGQLASQLERDIHRRGLQPNDKYLSTRSVAKFFNVSLSAAAQAMQELTERDVLVRRDRSGTFVGPVVQPAVKTSIKFVGILLPEHRAESANVSLDAIVHALRHRNKDLSVHISFLPTQDGLGFLRDLLSAPHLSPQKMVGMIPISCPREICQYIHQSGIPMVILGTPDPDLQHLPHMDIDSFAAGRLLTQHLIDRGHRQLAMLTPSGGRAGDHAFHEGVLEAMADSNVPPNALVSRITSHDLNLFRAQVEAMFQREPAPTGVICRAEKLLDAFFDAVRGIGLDPHRDMDVVFEKAAIATRQSRPGLTHVAMDMQYDAVADRIAQSLFSQLGDEAASLESFTIPVKLDVEPA